MPINVPMVEESVCRAGTASAETEALSLAMPISILPSTRTRSPADRFKSLVTKVLKPLASIVTS